MSTCVIVSFRLGGTDGVSIESAKWATALQELGFEIMTVAGSGPVEHLLPGLAIDATTAPGEAALAEAFGGADLVIAENICSLPLNPTASEAVAHALAGRPAILHHHDLAWQRPHLAHLGPPPDDPAWAHVTINRLSADQMAERGILATTIYNTFDPDPPVGDRDAARASLGLDEDTRLVLQPTRALGRKNVGLGLSLASALDAVYWLLGPAEDGYGPELNRLVRQATGPVLLGMPDRSTGATPPFTINDAYAASDVVALPSSWEGFGNPTIESATHERPLAVGSYPVAEELAEFGFRWFDPREPQALGQWLDDPKPELIEHNHAIARASFNVHDLAGRLAPVVDDVLARSPRKTL